MTEVQRIAINSPAAGLLIYQTDKTPGYYYYTGTYWIGLLGTGAGTLIDCEGNNYPTITIGSQVWMAENLRVTHYRNGDSIPNVTDGGQWQNLTTGAYCWYNNDKPANERYGTLYNWYTVDDSRGLCPEGWDVPTHAEWTTLSTYLGGSSVAGGKMKAISDLWIGTNTAATNASSFSGLPGGGRIIAADFTGIGASSIWWSFTENSSGSAWNRGLHISTGSLFVSTSDERSGLSVRCVRD